MASDDNDGQGSSGRYDLEERTLKYAKSISRFVKRLPRTICNQEDGRQLVKSSGSVGANYIEANEALSKKDFLMRMKIARKEAKESRYWLRLLDVSLNHELRSECDSLIGETSELLKILSAIINKSS